MTDLILRETRDGVARFALNQPEQLNPLGLKIIDQLSQALAGF